MQIFLFPTAKGCKVYSTMSQAVVLNYPKEGAAEDDEWLDIGIPETFVVAIKNDVVKTEALESME